MSFQAGLAAGAAEALVAGADALASDVAGGVAAGAGIAEATGPGAALGAGDAPAGCEPPQENAIGPTSPRDITSHLLGLLAILYLRPFNP